MRAAWIAPFLVLVAAAPAGAQGVRGSLRFTGTYLEYLSVERVSIPADEVPGEGITRILPDGTVVTCVPGEECYYYKGDQVRSASPLVEELQVMAWPGTKGISAQAHLRGRYGSDSFWPESSRRFEVVSCHVDVDREILRVRAGRQSRLGGLGAYTFDGASLLWKGPGSLRVEGFMGFSRARTVNETYTGRLLQEADVLAPDEGAVLWGVEGRLRLERTLSASVLYQRELRHDRAGLYSERMAFDARWARRGLAADLSVDLDVAALDLNEARVTIQGAMLPGLTVIAAARIHRPYFDLWTIWGAFAPVQYVEGGGAVSWEPHARWSARLDGAYRDYAETHVGESAFPIEEHGVRAALGITHRPGAWTLSGNGSIHEGHGGYRGAVDATVSRRWGPLEVGLHGSGTQQISELRFGEGSTLGLGVDARYSLRDLDLEGSVARYRHRYENRHAFMDHDQSWGRLGLTYRFGSDPAAPPIDALRRPR